MRWWQIRKRDADLARELRSDMPASYWAKLLPLKAPIAVSLGFAESSGQHPMPPSFRRGRSDRAGRRLPA
jgi:hypothetical protein